MPAKIKIRPSGASLAVRPLVLHDVTNPAASAKAASRRRMIATQSAAGSADHARHHVSRQAQS